MPIGTPLHEQSFHLNALLYGRPGTGKTTSALGMARTGRVLLVDAEAGAKSIALKNQDIPVDQIDVWPDDLSELTFDSLENLALDLADELRKDPDAYVGVVIDSMTELTKRLLEKQVDSAIVKAERLGKDRDRWQTELNDYGVAANQMRMLLRRFRDLPLHVVMTALERRDVDDDGLVSYGPAMSPAVAIDTTGLVDVVGHTSVNEIGDSMFFLGTFVPLNRRQAKDRLGVLPPKMVDPSVDRILGYADGSIVRSKDPLQNKIKRAMGKSKSKPEAKTTAEPEEASSSEATE